MTSLNQEHYQVRHASCSCGQLQAVVNGAPVRISICHCLACQKRSGSVFAAQARFARRDVQISGISQSWQRKGDEGSEARFHFCPTCAAIVWYEALDQPDVIAIPVGVFADPHFPTPTISVYEDHKHAWVVLPADIEHLA